MGMIKIHLNVRGFMQSGMDRRNCSESWMPERLVLRYMFGIKDVNAH
jgi:hypothetical protein